jgi:prolyl-tRNA editing enzyme YbaK/EbsC (Cys-tRNA(Pro) deacylase)
MNDQENTVETTPSSAAALSPSAQRVQDALRALGFDHQVTESAQPARTAAEAARLVKCDVGQIAKSLVFKTGTTGRAVLVITSGANTVNEWRVGVLLKETLEKAPPAFVREHAGYAVGGIPPLGHARPMETFIDEDLLRHPTIWAAGGTPNALFSMPSADLVRMTGGRVIRVKE